ncbi:FtsK/SpoIIIE family DNA translocase [Miniphocaeibacter halophilus]|uniref:DNA translocase FtsK 4TM domain-containing protein n=1 Tax=Miniphocaeibacter halophilus TaxID=2931922 RepID=A0AC61MTK1_9FIRM|nr:DNA translocase FtsK [Miniphocaeibacter halophilus]QQK07623.1 DNA translocase FtsK 4TM domain-containing protein [Miniphocaeibacter halophilus]
MAKKKKKKNKKNKYSKGLNPKNIVIVLTVLIFISYIFLIGNNTGFIGDFFKKYYFKLLGLGSYILPIIIIINSLVYIFNKLNKKLINIFLLLYGLFVISLILIDLNMNTGTILNMRLENSKILSSNYLGAGIIGAFITHYLLISIGKIGIYLLTIFYIIFSGIYIFNISFKELLEEIKQFFIGIANLFKKISNKIKKINIPNNNKSSIIKNNKSKNNNKNKIEVEDIVINDYSDNSPKSKNIIDNSNLEELDGEIEQLSVEDFSVEIEKETTPYKFPPLELLKDPYLSKGDSKDEVLNKAKKIESTLSSFGIDASVVEINKGPTVTCYELEPAPGVKVSKIVNLSDDLAMTLASSDIRIEAPIPGKSVVGIEVPNINKEDVYFKEIINSKEFMQINSLMPIALGKSISGKSIVTSIDKMPHLLIAGATGSGKSVCINTIIMSIIYKAKPDDVKMILIDPKVVELSVYNGIPHLAIPVVTNAKKANFALNWAVTEMERRYKIFSENYVRDIKSYNEKNSDNSLEKLPYIVIIIDELSDLMMVAAGEVEDSIARLAQMARACGIHLIVATQRPSVDVITGTIKANIPSRISFAVSSQIDSRTILDTSGAEKLLGKGDMLFFPSNVSKPVRIQGAFISDGEVEKIVSYLKNQNITDYDKNIIEDIDKKQEASENIQSTDELFKDAVKIILDENSASISLLQRKMKIGYARAGRLIDEMEEMGIVSGYEGSKPRKILVGKDYLKDIGE